MKLTAAEADGCRDILTHIDESKVLRIFAWKFGLDGASAGIVECLQKQRLARGFVDTSAMTTKQKAVDYIVRDAATPLDILCRQDVRKDHLKKYMEAHGLEAEVGKHKAARLKNVILASWKSAYRVASDTQEDDEGPKKMKVQMKRKKPDVPPMKCPRTVREYRPPAAYGEERIETYVQPELNYGGPCHRFEFIKVLQL